MAGGVLETSPEVRPTSCSGHILLGAPSPPVLTCQVSESSCSCNFSSRAEATASPSRTLSALSSSCSLATLFSSGSELFLCRETVSEEPRKLL